jgi:predicted RND superfamily exporter protein
MGKDSKFEQGVVKYSRWVIRWRWPILLAVLLAVGFAASGARNLTLATNYRVFFGPDNPDLAAFEAVQNIYTKNDNILFVVAPEDGEVFTNETLAAVEEMTAEAWQIPYSIRVDSIANFQHSVGVDDDLIVEDLISGAANLSSDQLREVEQTAMSRPELYRRLISESGAVTGVNVTLQLPGEDPGELFEPVEAARALAANIEAAYPHLTVRLTGMSMLNHAFTESGMKDLTTLIPLMNLVLIIAMILLLRSISATFATVSVIGLSAATAMGIAGWNNVLLEPVSALAPTMILTMAIADSVHILVTMLDEMRAGKSKTAALVESVRINFVPVLLTSVTTTIGFLSMNFSDSPPLNRLGTITALGVVAAFALSVSFLPALMAILPVRVKARAETSKRPVFDRLGGYVVARSRPIAIGTAALAVALILLVPTNEVSDEFVKYFDETIQFRQDTDFTTANLTGIYQVQMSLGSGEPGGISNPSYLARLDEFSTWLREQPEVVHVSTLADTMRRLNMNMHGDDPAFYTLPEDRALAAQYLLLYEMSLPYGLDLNNTINVDKSSTRVVTTTKDVPTRDFLALSERSEQWLRDNAPREMWARATGPAVMFSRITERNIRSMVFGTIFAFLLISTILVVALRNLRIGVLSVLPNLIPAVMAFGMWGLLVGKVGFAVSVVGAMTMGIVVDDTVHFLSKYLRARREKNLDAAGGVRYAFNSVGRALWVTSAVLVAGFIVLAQSTFKQNSDMGLLAAITIVFALVADFFLLPGLLMLIDRRKPATLEIPGAPTAQPALQPVPVPVRTSIRTSIRRSIRIQGERS